MPSDVARCGDCNTAFPAIPAWLATAKVKFTCNNCPKRPSRGNTRFEAVAEPVLRTSVVSDPDIDIDDTDDTDDVADLEVSLDDLDEDKDDKGL